VVANQNYAMFEAGNQLPYSYISHVG